MVALPNSLLTSPDPNEEAAIRWWWWICALFLVVAVFLGLKARYNLVVPWERLFGAAATDEPCPNKKVGYHIPSTPKMCLELMDVATEIDLSRRVGAKEAECSVAERLY
ncbi:unnamed protein product [Absidia cylindrospora]